MNAISTLTILPKTKQDINNYVELVKSDILSGYINPLESAQMLKSFEDIVKALRGDEQIKKYIESECDKYVEKSFSHNGSMFTKQERTKYIYENCKDDVWNDLMTQKAQIEAAIKGREGWLKTLKYPTPDVNTGCIVNPPATEFQTVISITLAK